MEIQWPCELSQETTESLTSIARKVDTFSRKPSSTTNGGIIYLVKGIATVTFSGEGTNTMNAGIFGQGFWLGGAIISQTVRYKATIEALEPLEMLLFPQNKIEELCKTNPEIYKWLYHSTHKAQQAWVRAQISTLYDKETRIVSSLLEIAKYIPNIKGSFQKIHASQRQLSLITGISRPRLNETLKALETANEISLNAASFTY